ncbi:hypothetical protein SESBI_27160 [Sesbania bispinosa]|nr:hypothetical protein SESBI_27160 [Sesbania bispinosa]
MGITQVLRTLNYLKKICYRTVNRRNDQRDERETKFLGDPLCPVVRLSQEERESIHIPWQRSILIKLIGKRMSLKYFHARLMKLQRPSAPMKVIDLDNEYFIVYFQDLSDLQHVFEGGLWVLADHYMVIQRRQLEFFPLEDDLRSVAVWVHIIVKIDTNTLREKADHANGAFATERGKFARVCIEVDLRRILISKFSLKGRVYPVDYKGLHLVCFHCGGYGQKKETCPLLCNVDQKSKETSSNIAHDNDVRRDVKVMDGEELSKHSIDKEQHVRENSPSGVVTNSHDTFGKRIIKLRKGVTQANTKKDRDGGVPFLVRRQKGELSGQKTQSNEAFIIPNDSQSYERMVVQEERIMINSVSRDFEMVAVNGNQIKMKAPRYRSQKDVYVDKSNMADLVNAKPRPPNIDIMKGSTEVDVQNVPDVFCDGTHEYVEVAKTQSLGANSA